MESPVQQRTEQQMTFAWAHEQAQAVAALDEKIEDVMGQVERDEMTRDESVEWRDVMDLKAQLAASKADAIRASSDVADCAVKVRDAKKRCRAAIPAILASVREGRAQLKALRQSRDEAAAGVLSALARGGGKS